MSTDRAPNSTSADVVESFGYTQSFTRTLKSFTSFAVAFSFVSITTGIFTSYGSMLTTGGPAGIWMWIPVAAGQLLVALIYGALSARIPLSGYSYQWASRLVNPKLGWCFGWMAICYLVVAATSAAYALTTQALLPLFGASTSATGIKLITIGVIVVWVALIIFSTKITAKLNASAVVAEIVGVAGIAVVLLIALLVGSKGHAHNLIATGTIPHAGYFHFNGPFMLSILLGAYTIVGFESASNLAEETQNATQVVPRAMVRAVLLAGALGMIFLIVLDLAIPNVKSIETNAAPVSAIMRSVLGSGAEKLFLVVVVLAIFACGMVVLLTASRILWAMARDRRFPAPTAFSTINRKTQTPVGATLLPALAIVVLVLILGGKPTTLFNVIVASSILAPLCYLGTILMFAAVRHRLPKRTGAFDLGRWELPVIVLAVVWLLFLLAVLVGPSAFWTPVKICILLLIIGAVILAGHMLVNRQDFEHEPGLAFLDGPAQDGGEPEVPVGAEPVVGEASL